jgi:predicted NAD/FAD-binding protein
MRIAVIGTGIAGLGAAYVLSRAHEVELFERNDYAGGHTNTIAVRRTGRELPLDTGFIVHNERNYPQLVRLFRELEVRTQGSDMSFSVTCRRCDLQYSGRRPLAQPQNALRPSFLRLVRDVTRFLRTARGLLDDPRYAESTLEDVLLGEGYSQQFRDHYLVPLTASIWSTAPSQALDFPAAYAIRFFDNHGMLGFRRHPWRTVVGGSREYVRALLERSPARIHLGRGALSLTRHADGVELRTADGEARPYDKAVVAAHADEALALLADPSANEQRILGAFAYTRNETVLHTDDRFLPTRKAARASWNFHLDDCRVPAAGPTITYYLNRLQQLDEPEHYCVTLNRSSDIREDRVIERLVYDHPKYTVASLRAQTDLPLLAGAAHTVYCGAYHGFGFHEDGLVSGLAAASALGVEW